VLVFDSVVNGKNNKACDLTSTKDACRIEESNQLLTLYIRCKKINFAA